MIPKLRFPEFTDEWQIKELGNVADFFDGKRVPIESVERQSMQGVYPYYGASGIIDHVNRYIFDGEYILLAEDGANILMRSSPVAFLVKGKFWLNNHAHIMQAHGSNMYLATYLERIKYDNYNTGTTQPKLNATIVKKINIAIPSELEQEKIAEFLTVVDERVEKIEKKLALLQQYKKSVMQKIFTQQIRFKDENGNSYPEWEDKRFSEIFDYDQPTKYIVESTEYDDSHNTPVLTAGKTFILGYTDETQGIYTNLPVVIFDDFTTASHFVDFKFKVKSSAMKILQPKKDIDAKIAYELLSRIEYAAEDHKRHWIGEFQNFTVQLPSYEEQQKIATFLTTLDDKVKVEQTRLTTAKQWKKGLLQRMFV